MQSEQGSTLTISLFFIVCVLMVSGGLMTALQKEGQQLSWYRQISGDSTFAKHYSTLFVDTGNNMAVGVKDERFLRAKEDFKQRYPLLEEEKYQLLAYTKAFLEEAQLYFNSDSFFTHNARLQQGNYTVGNKEKVSFYNKLYLNHSNNYEALTSVHQQELTDYEKVKNNFYDVQNLLDTFQKVEEVQDKRQLEQVEIYFKNLEHEMNKPYQFLLYTVVEQELRHFERELPIKSTSKHVLLSSLAYDVEGVNQLVYRIGWQYSP